jgi:transposase-like protein
MARVDQDGEALDILVQPLRNRQAGKKFFRKLLHRLQYIPRAIITGKLGSYAAAKAEVVRPWRRLISAVEVRVGKCHVPEAEGNCVAAKQGGEQPEANCWSVGRRTRFGGM